MADVTIHCFQCGQKTSFIDNVGFRGECEHCNADAHVCKNCQFYEPSAYNECREPSAEVVREKERANYCDFFSPNSGSNTAADSKPDLMSAAEALFKKNK